MLAGLINDQNHKWWTLGAVSIGLFMIILDNTIVNVALPTMETARPEAPVSRLRLPSCTVSQALFT
jgi:hypothetical protein